MEVERFQDLRDPRCDFCLWCLPGSPRGILICYWVSSDRLNHKAKVIEELVLQTELVPEPSLTLVFTRNWQSYRRLFNWLKSAVKCDMLPTKSKNAYQASFFLVGEVRRHNSSFTRKEISRHAPNHWSLRHFTEVGPYIFVYLAPSRSHMSY